MEFFSPLLGDNPPICQQSDYYSGVAISQVGCQLISLWTAIFSTFKPSNLRELVEGKCAGVPTIFDGHRWSNPWFPINHYKSL